VSTLKTDGALRDCAYRRINWLLTGVLAFLVVAFVFALAKHLRVPLQDRAGKEACQ
jgi:hypothetical protein